MRVTKARLNRLSDICSGIGQIAFASIAVPFLLDKFNVAIVLLGLATAFTFWTLSWYLAR